jgi:hypothetical protein
MDWKKPLELPDVADRKHTPLVNMSALFSYGAGISVTAK